MSLSDVRRRIERIERATVGERDDTRRMIELVALARLRANGRDTGGLSLKMEGELLAIVGVSSREEFRAGLPMLREALAREKRRRGLE